ncbi:unnamed protein product, partial [Adineta steineri]
VHFRFCNRLTQIDGSELRTLSVPGRTLRPGYTSTQIFTIIIFNKKMAINLNNTTAIDSFIAGFNGTTQFNGASWKMSYPPVIRSGPVESHDLPFLNMVT